MGEHAMNFTVLSDEFVEYRIVIRDADGNTSEPRGRPLYDRARAIARARRLAPEFPPEGGCFAAPGLNPWEVWVQAQVTAREPHQKSTWRTVNKFARVAVATETRLSLKTVERT
jgi:hypothetical protein